MQIAWNDRVWLVRDPGPEGGPEGVLEEVSLEELEFQGGFAARHVALFTDREEAAAHALTRILVGRALGGLAGQPAEKLREVRSITFLDDKGGVALAVTIPPFDDVV